VPAQVFEYDPPDRFVAGTVGEPGQRTFYLQASGGGRVTSVALEKQQVAALAERVDEILDEVLRRSGGVGAPAVAPTALQDRAPLDNPVVEDFRVGTLALVWDGDAGVLVIEAHATVLVEDSEDDVGLTDQPGDDPADLAATAAAAAGAAGGADEDVEAGDVLRVRLGPAQARAFAQRATAVVGAGRPLCPFCGLPLDRTGHVCPRQNGYRRR
jgi:uncharacterized repeat protein (TIGR03847 family)